jgi:hypothetical protein
MCMVLQPVSHSDWYHFPCPDSFARCHLPFSATRSKGNTVVGKNCKVGIDCFDKDLGASFNLKVE